MSILNGPREVRAKELIDLNAPHGAITDTLYELCSIMAIAATDTETLTVGRQHELRLAYLAISKCADKLRKTTHL